MFGLAAAVAVVEAVLLVMLEIAAMRVRLATQVQVEIVVALG